MPLRLYMDVHIPAAVTTGVRRCDVDVITSQEDGTREREDEPLLERATELGRLLVTQDDDFLAIAADWQATGRSFVGIIYAHQRGPSIGQMIDDLELLAAYSEPDELASLVTFLPLR
ncbi:MAG: DUF5615 family PIN-like protein [Planctomycetaceae bacterium]